MGTNEKLPIYPPKWGPDRKRKVNTPAQHANSAHTKRRHATKLVNKEAKVRRAVRAARMGISPLELFMRELAAPA